MERYWILLMFGGPLVGLLVVATIAKYIDVWRAKSWLTVPGRVVSSKSVNRKVPRPGVDNGMEVRNFAAVTYEFKLDGKKRTGSRVSIGEDLGNVAVEETLIRYPTGKDVTVFYNPDNPEQAVLERDPPKNFFQITVLLIAGLTAGGIVAVDGLSGIEKFLERTLANPKNAPFVIGFSFFAMCCGLMAWGLSKQAAVSQPGATKAEQTAQTKIQSQGLWILWLCTAVFTAAACWFATTRGGKV